ncbi:MAG: hypothetical protein OER12_06610 [Acidimicrobiia bacterium]|nr:hypothetical protein [Acidimicrobiia bacterium]
MLKLALLGDPVGHSLSPRLHAAALQATGLEGEYVARRVDADGLADAVAEIRDGRLHGANVTMPHKRLAAELADTRGSDAQRADSVNTLLSVDGVVHGESTDVEGIRRAWGPLSDGGVLILGAGGAAAAAVLALEGRPLAVSARRPERAHRMLERTGVAGTVVEWGIGLPGRVVVNATPLGMGREGLSDRVIEQASGLFEMPYGADPTHAATRAKALGLPVVEGLEMLVAQAALSFEIWTGLSAPIDAMRRAVEDDHSAGSNL